MSVLLVVFDVAAANDVIGILVDEVIQSTLIHLGEIIHYLNNLRSTQTTLLLTTTSNQATFLEILPWHPNH